MKHREPQVDGPAVFLFHPPLGSYSTLSALRHVPHVWNSAILHVTDKQTDGLANTNTMSYPACVVF